MTWSALAASLLGLILSAPACGTRTLSLGGGLGRGGSAGGTGGAIGTGGPIGTGGQAAVIGTGGTGGTIGTGGSGGTGGDSGGTGGGAGGTGGAPSQACARESDCPMGMVCGYAIHGGCDAPGVCVPRWPLPGAPACGALLALCGCSGGLVEAGCNYAPGYAPAPTTSDLSQCADAGTDPAQCRTWGLGCAAGGMCCDGLGCSPSGSAALPGVCVPL